MAMSRFLACLVLACSCVAPLLAPPVQARRLGGLVGAAETPDPARFLHAAAEPVVVVHGVRRRAPSWSWPAGRGEEELRSVPAGPDPLHHHGTPRRPEQEQKRVP